MITYYIAPTGNDNATGTTPNQAFATLNHAKKNVRQQAGKVPITVYLREGTYTQNETFTLTEQDSGSESAPIIYRAYEKENARIIGNETRSQFSPITDEKINPRQPNQAHLTDPPPEITVSTPESSLISLTDVHHVTFQNLTFEYSNGITLTGGTHVQIAGCTLRNMGQIGIIVDGGQHHTLQSCNVYHTGDAGIHIQGGDRHTLTPSHHTVDNCHIHHIAQNINTHAPAIKVAGVGIRISHNHIHDCPHSALLLTGNDHLIQYNHIHHACLQTGNIGALYMIGRDWTERGTQIQYNHFHDLGTYNTGSTGIYMDNCASSATILGNIFVRCTRAILIGGGRNHRIDNNIFVQCEPALQIDGRGLDKHPVWHNMVYNLMKPQFESMNPLAPPYKTHYPELREVAMYYQAEDGIPPEGNLVLRNISYQSTWHHIHWNATQKMVALQNNLIDETPLFIDSTNDNYQLHEDSPAYEIGIKPIPFEQIGLYNDAFRQSKNILT